MSQDTPSLAAELAALDAQIEKLKADIRQHMETVTRLNADKHETTDATRHLDDLLQQFTSLTQVRSKPKPH